MYPDAACRDEDPELFFPHQGRGAVTGAYRAQYAEAAAVCARCPSRLQCLEDNLDIPDGVWGGLDRRDRGRILVRQGRLNSKGRAQFRNMSPIPNDNQVLAQRARHAAAMSEQARATADRRNARRREQRALPRSA
jgi:WhiB family redox-sensing transcriptional regulator